MNMHTTKHIQQRMSQRGVSREMVDYVLNHGTPEDSKYVLGRKEALKQLEELKSQERLLKKILDKGGVVVVAENDALITTYNCEKRRH
jgi:hypothetical protein